MDEQVERYHKLRALVEELRQSLPPALPPDAFLTLDSYLERHCKRCGERLDEREPGAEQTLCPACHLHLLGQQPLREPAALLSLLKAQSGDPPLAERLLMHLLAAPERELYRLNAYHLAERLGVPRRQLLAVLAAAVLTGLLTLNWELFCLACNFQRPTFASLTEASSRQTCTNCHATYDAPMDEEIVVTFTVSPTVRALDAEADDWGWRQQINEQYGRVMGHDLLTVQAFRDLFVNHPLPLHERFQISRVAFLFTDLGNSTGLYARRGDPRAYNLVREHFDLLTEMVSAAGGAVVKTIGDAVMAAFPTSEMALSAALQAQRAIPGFNQARQLDEQDALQLKVGLHVGPALIVTLNERLDYFGSTVNIAARLQKLASPGEILFSEDFLRDVGELPLVEQRPLPSESIVLRGLEERAFTLYRWQALP